jgi:hypothetical protein
MEKAHFASRETDDNQLRWALRKQNQIADRVDVFVVGVAEPRHERVATVPIIFIENEGEAEIAVNVQPIPGRDGSIKGTARCEAEWPG